MGFENSCGWLIALFPILSFRNENVYFGYPVATVPFKQDVLEADNTSYSLQVTITWKAICVYEGEDYTSLKDPRLQPAGKWMTV